MIQRHPHSSFFSSLSYFIIQIYIIGHVFNFESTIKAMM